MPLVVFYTDVHRVRALQRCFDAAPQSVSSVVDLQRVARLPR